MSKQEDSFDHLTPEEYRVLRKSGTESPYSHEYREINKGAFYCKACGNQVFDTKNKFESGTGWPSFTQPVRSDALTYHTDWKLFVPRTEVRCGKCGSHLGHVFDDGPQPTRKRYCINGIALKVDK
jgi:peptide-methionine (R)-S-oxide reductase